MISGSRQVAIKYEDKKGRVTIKHCGTAKSARRCISWIKRMGYKKLSQEIISADDSAPKNVTPPKKRRIKSCI